MDIKDLIGKMLNADTLSGLGSLTGASDKDVKGVLASALPALLNGAKGQADDAATAEGFVGALSDHAKVDTANLSSFISGIDLEDGGKIIGHLLGSSAEKTTAEAAEKAGVEKGIAGNILSAAAPLLMSLLGQQTAAGDDAASNNSAGISGLMGSLLGNVDLGSLLGGLFGGSDSSDESTLTELTANGSKKKKKKKKDSKKEEGGLLNTILGFFKG
ncbi:MAG: DUF937 domain-containing protein [Clostridia bacterium]|nr:DUF937 domain-containing protein [Clostridia bacterium]